MSDKISIIIPVLNEEKAIETFLEKLQLCRKSQCEIIVVDGGSKDSTYSLAHPLCDKVIQYEPGRAKQMHCGAQLASGKLFLFLHVDTVLPSSFCSILLKLINTNKNYWGRFDVSLSGKATLFRVIENLMNFRSRLTGIATGDQAIFVSRSLYEKSNGFPDIPLMEDIAFSKKLKSFSSPVCLREKVITSSRRWEQYGIWKTIVLMWRLRFAFFCGVDPLKLKEKYQ